MTPDQVYCVQIDAVRAARHVALERAFGAHPERFVTKLSTPPAKPAAAWINPPETKRAAGLPSPGSIEVIETFRAFLRPGNMTVPAVPAAV